MRRMNKQLLWGLTYLFPVVMPLIIVLGYKDADEDTQTQTAQSLIITLLQVALMIVVGIVLGSLVFGSLYTASRGNYAQWLEGNFSGNTFYSILSNICIILGNVGWLLLLYGAYKGFTGKLLHIPFLENLVKKLRKALFRRKKAANL